MRLYIIILIILISNSLNAQNINADFPDSNYYWNEEHTYLHEPLNKYEGHEGLVFDKGDTVYNGKLYRKLYYKVQFINDWIPSPAYLRRDTLLIGLIRNDKLNKKVYYVDFFMGDSIQNEQVLYDFDLNVGDKYPSNFQNKIDRELLLGDSVVQRIDTIIDPYNIKRAVYILDTNNLQTSPIIQGIGNTRGLLIKTLYNPFEFYFDFMNCISINQDFNVRFIHYNYTAMSLDSCVKYQFTTVENINNSHFNIYPNPVNSNFYINHKNENSEFELINTIGETFKINGVYDGNSWSFNMNEYNNGIYILKIISDGKIYFSKISKI